MLNIKVAIFNNDLNVMQITGIFTSSVISSHFGLLTINIIYIQPIRLSRLSSRFMALSTLIRFFLFCQNGHLIYMGI